MQWILNDNGDGIFNCGDGTPMVNSPNPNSARLLDFYNIPMIVYNYINFLCHNKPFICNVGDNVTIQNLRSRLTNE